jgi:hypothetical protein
MIGAHIGGMAKGLMALAALFALSGCGFDEAQAKLKCEMENQGDQLKVEGCVKAARQDYHEQVEAAKSQAKNP